MAIDYRRFLVRMLGTMRILASLAVFIGVAGAQPALAQVDDASRRVDQLTKAARMTVKSIADTRKQLLNTTHAHNALFFEHARDRRRIYAKFREEAETLQILTAKSAAKATAMTAEADTRFRLWAEANAVVADPATRRRRQERLGAVEGRFAEIRLLDRKMDELSGPFMEALRRQVSLLGGAVEQDAEAFKRLEPDAVELNARAEALARSIDGVIAAAQETIRTLGVEASQ